MTKLKLPPIITHAYIMLTEQCNLRCQYCYIKDRATKNSFPIEWMEQVKNMFTCYNKPRIIFFGGEPLLKVDLIKEIVEKYNNDFQFQVVTNGTVNFHKFMDEVYEPNRTKFDVQISWDGNIDTRKMASGNVSNNLVYENIMEELKKDRILVGRCVLNEESVKSFYETYLTFKKLNNAYRFGADFTIAHQENFQESYFEDLKENLIKIYEDIKCDLHNSYEKLYIPNLLLKTISNILENKPVISCDVGNYVVIKPNGDIYPCTILSQKDERFKLGNINTNADTEIINLLKYKSSCQKECAYKSICDGGCRFERIVNFPTNWCSEICEHTCKISQSIYDATKKFLDSLDDIENENLYKILIQYNIWSINYRNNNHNRINNQEKLKSINI